MNALHEEEEQESGTYSDFTGKSVNDKKKKRNFVTKLLCYPCDRISWYLDDLVKEELQGNVKVKKELEYSSGESDDSTLIPVGNEKQYFQMNQDEKDKHIFILWQRLAKKLRGAVYIS